MTIPSYKSTKQNESLQANTRRVHFYLIEVARTSYTDWDSFILIVIAHRIQLCDRQETGLPWCRRRYRPVSWVRLRKVFSSSIASSVTPCNTIAGHHHHHWAEEWKIIQKFAFFLLRRLRSCFSSCYWNEVVRLFDGLMDVFYKFFISSVFCIIFWSTLGSAGVGACDSLRHK